MSPRNHRNISLVSGQSNVFSSLQLHSLRGIHPFQHGNVTAFRPPQANQARLREGFVELEDFIGARKHREFGHRVEGSEFSPCIRGGAQRTQFSRCNIRLPQRLFQSRQNYKRYFILKLDTVRIVLELQLEERPRTLIVTLGYWRGTGLIGNLI